MSYILVVDDSLVDRQLSGRLLECQPRYHVEYACNGLEALELVEAKLPLALVTDLFMSGMDGLELIDAMHRKFPNVPVIVMTAHGSEEIGVKALALGAADYVPKARLVSELRKSVESVLAIAAGDRSLQRLSHCLRREELEYELNNDLLLIPPLVRQLEQSAADLGVVDESDRVRLSRALVEALRNAICHGNLELTADEIQMTLESPSPAVDAIAVRSLQPPYCDRRVYVRAVVTAQEARFAIRDEGPGFDTSRLPNIKSDPTRLSSGGGRGLVLIQMFMDEVAYNRAGNEITLIKRARKPTDTESVEQKGDRRAY
jgi:CheY-like chemotaxis protein/anti-sigma regulatory factor (Ser/Thr protein kinase)